MTIPFRVKGRSPSATFFLARGAGFSGPPPLLGGGRVQHVVGHLAEHLVGGSCRLPASPASGADRLRPCRRPSPMRPSCRSGRCRNARSPCAPAINPASRTALGSLASSSNSSTSLIRPFIASQVLPFGALADDLEHALQQLDVMRLVGLRRWSNIVLQLRVLRRLEHLWHGLRGLRARRNRCPSDGRGTARSVPCFAIPMIVKRRPWHLPRTAGRSAAWSDRCAPRSIAPCRSPPSAMC